jgi:hypothetical protein
MPVIVLLIVLGLAVLFCGVLITPILQAFLESRPVPTQGCDPTKDPLERTACYRAQREQHPARGATAPAGAFVPNGSSR